MECNIMLEYCWSEVDAIVVVVVVVVVVVYPFVLLIHKS